MQKPIIMYHTSSRFSQKSSLVGRTWLRSICLPGCSRNRFDWDFTINWGDGMGMGRGEAVRVFTKSSPTTSFTAIFWLDFTRIHISITAWSACVSLQNCASLLQIILIFHIAQQLTPRHVPPHLSRLQKSWL